MTQLAGLHDGPAFYRGLFSANKR